MGGARKEGGSDEALYSRAIDLPWIMVNRAECSVPLRGLSACFFLRYGAVRFYPGRFAVFLRYPERSPPLTLLPRRLDSNPSFNPVLKALPTTSASSQFHIN